MTFYEGILNTKLKHVLRFTYTKQVEFKYINDDDDDDDANAGKVRYMYLCQCTN